jgi:hypothetical protein
MAPGNVGERCELGDLRPDDHDPGVAQDVASGVHRHDGAGPDDEIRDPLAARLGHVLRVPQ